MSLAVALEGCEGFPVGGDFHAGEGTRGVGDELIAFALHEVDGQGVAGEGGVVCQVAGEHHSQGSVVEGGHEAYFGSWSRRRRLRRVSRVVLHDVLGA